MVSEERDPPRADALHAEILGVGEDAPRLRRVLGDRQPEDIELRAVLRRFVPVKLLELVGTTPPWCDRPLVAASVVLNPRTPRHVAQRLLPGLYWRDLADVAGSVRLQVAIRHQAESQLRDGLRDLRPGDRITLARVATRGLLRDLLRDDDARVVEAALDNPRLAEDDLLAALRAKDARRVLLEKCPESFRWRERHAVRAALVQQPRTPLGVALGQLSSLLARDLRRVAEDEALAPLLRVSAERLLSPRA